jgi:hypothetical protein
LTLLDAVVTSLPAMVIGVLGMVGSRLLSSLLRHLVVEQGRGVSGGGASLGVREGGERAASASVDGIGGIDFAVSGQLPDGEKLIDDEHTLVAHPGRLGQRVARGSPSFHCSFVVGKSGEGKSADFHESPFALSTIFDEAYD